MDAIGSQREIMLGSILCTCLWLGWHLVVR
jgi:hypothetical protein